MGTAGGDHHVVDRGREILEERLSEAGSVASKAAMRCASSSSAARSRRSGLRPVRITLGALGAGSPGRFEPDAGAAADDDDGLAEQLRFALGGYSSGCGGHDSSGVVRATGHQVAAETALTLPARCGLRHRSK